MKKSEKLKTVMIIEDEHDIRVSLRQVLEEEGYFVVSSANGADALTKLQAMTAPSLIILDINMPIMNGDQFLAVAKADASLATIPIIQLSAGADAQREGVHCWLKKPFELDELLKLVNSCS